MLFHRENNSRRSDLINRIDTAFSCQKEQHFIQHEPSGLEGYFSALPEKA